MSHRLQRVGKALPQSRRRFVIQLARCGQRRRGRVCARALPQLPGCSRSLIHSPVEVNSARCDPHRVRHHARQPRHLEAPREYEAREADGAPAGPDGKQCRKAGLTSLPAAGIPRRDHRRPSRGARHGSVASHEQATRLLITRKSRTGRGGEKCIDRLTRLSHRCRIWDQALTSQRARHPQQ
jgi:hypothetical protein